VRRADLDSAAAAVILGRYFAGEGLELAPAAAGGRPGEDVR
jgi:hypothetical protein